jgi:hypothetical protein
VVPLCLKDTPQRFRKGSLSGGKVEEQELREQLKDEFTYSFGTAKDSFKPEISVLFKDISYETIHNPVFMDELKRVMPKSTVERLFSEHDAAPERVSTVN